MAQMTGTASRFVDLTRSQAIALLCALCALVMVGTVRLSAAGATTSPGIASPPGNIVTPVNNDDLILYTTIISRAANGEPYYRVAADELRKGGYPLRPFITFRLPTLAVIGATIGVPGMTAILYLLVALTMLVWWRRLVGSYDDPGRRVSAIGLLFAGMLVAFWREFVVLHELWAGILLALAFGIHRADRWLPSAIIAGCALFIRELALPFILLMGAFALWDRRWREVATLSAIITLFTVALAVHAQQVFAVTSLADPVSPGWVAIGGWDAFLRTMYLSGALRIFPDWIGHMTLILCLFGWFSWATRTGLFGTLLFAGYGAMFMILGRPDNFHWGLMVAPTYLIGLTFLPRAFFDLRAAIMPKLSINNLQ